MTTPYPLYEVSLSGGRPTFQIALPPSGGLGTIVAGDLDGYFAETPKGFRYIPSSVLTIAVTETAKRNYEVLSTDADGRPERVRMKSAALSGMIADRAYPTYPDSARGKRISGEVRLSVRIDKNGRIQEVNVVSGPAELQKAAIDAMKKWRFKPIQIDQHPVEVESEFLFNLQAPQNE
jgi:TonB family protein